MNTSLPGTLAEWLDYIERQHAKPIELGLERVARVRDALALSAKPIVITVAGTNGKGSTCAMLDFMLRAAGYQVGVYSSPHLIRYNERVRIGGQELSDDKLSAAFAAVEAARGDIPLTYFEYGTLAAMSAFAAANLDVLILEVGLGGRLDAVNAFEPDCAIVTGVAMDHMDYLGATREAIGFEKAGIFRPGKPAICSDPNPPATLTGHAANIGADLWQTGRDFGYVGDKTQWSYWGRNQRRNSLAYPSLRGANQLLNASGALAALEALKDRLPVSMQAVREGLMHVELAGRFQVLPGRPSVILDVAHNPQSAAVLADNLSNMGFFSNTYAVCGMLADKDIAGSLRPMLPRVDRWFFCDLPGPRGASATAMAAHLSALNSATDGASDFAIYPSPLAAYQAARDLAQEGDRIVAFGSFLTVADILQHISSPHKASGTRENR